MRRLILGPLLALALCSSAADADVFEDECAAYAAVAKVIAEARQVGVPRDEIMGALTKDTGTKNMVAAIYAFPRLQDETQQQQLIKAVHDRVLATCLADRQARLPGLKV